MTVFFITFGCKVNCYETGCLKEQFCKEGFIISERAEDADIIIINSCTVTSSSDKKVRQMLRKIRNECPSSVVVLTGCYPQAFKNEAEKITEADIITGTKDRKGIIKLVQKYLDEKNHICNISEYKTGEEIEDICCSSFDSKTRAFVKIQDGCNQFCSYCIIPYSRGRIRSKPLDSVISEVTTLAENGHQEIVLVGINLAFYGYEYNLSLTDAVEACCNIKGVMRVRLGSLEPEKINRNDLLRLSSLKQFCPQFHLSLQSGCNNTLWNMNRKYTAEEYLELVNEIRIIFPDASVTTDIMVGFPGETEQDFQESLDFVEKLKFSRIHVFPYSPRSGTKAASMPNQIPGNIKSNRAALMTELGMKLEKNFLDLQCGKTFPILFEKENCTDFHQGYSPNYTLVKIKRIADIKSLRNRIFYVNIKESMNDFCIGEISEEMEF